MQASFIVPKIYTHIQALSPHACSQPTPTRARGLQQHFPKSNPRAIHEAQASAVDVSPSRDLRTLLWRARQGESAR
jgi:hypothetical protein